MKDNEVVVTIPCNDHAIFLDHYGILYERIGLAWKKDKDCLEGYDEYYYIDEDGFWQIPEGVNEETGASIIAHRGETIPFENLCYVFGYTTFIPAVIPDLKSYDVHIDKSNMTGSLKVFLDREWGDKSSSYKLTVETDKGVIVMSLSKDIHFTELGLKDEKEDVLKTLRDYLVSFLIEYSEQIGFRVEFGIFFRKSTYLRAEDRKRQNRFICQEEKKYLGPIRKFVKEEFEKDWNDVLGKENERELYKKEHDEWQQEAASRYDKDPNLME